MMSINVPLSLLEDIFRLLDYLGRRGDRDDLHFHKTGYSQRFEHDNALWELKLKIAKLQRHIVETYLLTVDDITEYERYDLQEWVAAGNSVYDNPYMIYNDAGAPMDFINGCRVGMEMDEDSPNFSEEPDEIIGNGRNDSLPF